MQHSLFEFIERLACSVRTTTINASLFCAISERDSKLTIFDFDECDFVNFDNCAIADLHKSSAHIFFYNAPNTSLRTRLTSFFTSFASDWSRLST
jgi:hypothetical protein